MDLKSNQILNQLAALWKQLGFNQRVSLVLSAVLVFGGLGMLVLWSSRSDYVMLYGKLPESESGRVVAALDEAKVPYRVSGGGGTILVPAAKVHQMRMQLASKGIPKSDGVGFEIFDKPNFGISDFVQRANYLRAVQGELARTISQLDSIEAARVMVVMPENRLLVDQHKKPTASVFLRVRGNTPLPGQSVNAIRFLVANAVEGLQANYVTVVDNLGNVLSENADSDSISGVTSTQLAARKNLEQYLSKKAEDMLATVLGPGQAVVRVAAEINFDTNTKVEEKYDPEVQVTRISTINDENTETVNGSTGGAVAGVVPNSESETNTTVATAAPPTTNTTKKKVTNNQYELNKTTSNVVQAAGGLRRISAAVFVAKQFEGVGAARKYVERPPEEIKKLRQVVQSALGIVEGDPSRKDQITLEEMPFNDQPMAEMVRVIAQNDKKEFWLSLAMKSVYPAIAAAVLFIFWRIFKKTTVDELQLGPLPPQTEPAPAHRGGLTSHGAPVSVEVLNQLLRENPGNMTHAIRTWMDRGRPVN